MLDDLRALCLLLSCVGLTTASSGCGDDEPAGSGGSGAAVGNGGGGGEFENCIPGTKYPCYTGPLNTKNVGACAEGRATCNDDGVSLGPCEGEILPAAETCLTPEDDDCDGPSNEEGEGCVCAPGSSDPCYSGPAGTEGVGLCKSGVQTCDQSGTGISDCIGEVVPAAEDCATPADESCEGVTPDGCPGDFAGAAIFGDASEQTARAVAVAADGSHVVAGVCAGAVDFGGGELPPAGGSDAYVLRLDATGGFLGAAHYGGTGDDVARAVAAGAGGEIWITGSFENQINFGGAPLVSAGGSDVFVAMFDSTGAHVSSQRFGDGASSQHGRAITALPGGGWAVAAAFTGSIDFGGGALVSAGSSDIAYAVFNAAGSYVRSARFGDAGLQDIASLDSNPAGDLLLAGSFSGVIDFGLGGLTSAGMGDVYVARIDGDGTTAWARRFGDQEPQDGVARWTPSGEVVVGGTVTGEMNFGGGPIVAADPDIYVARLDAAGQHVWTRHFGGPGAQRAWDLTIAPSDEHVIAAGSFAGTADFGGGAMTGAGGADVLVLSLAP